MTSTATHRIPGITCNVCGPWSSSSRLRVPLPSQADEFVGVTFLRVADWMNARERWADLLDIERSCVEPGATLGPPSGTCSAGIAEDVVHPMPGLVWVAPRVRNALASAGLTGMSFSDVRLSSECEAPDLSELVVHGRAYRQGSTEESLRLCEICGRRGFPLPKKLAVDEARWDGSDFVCPDSNPNIVLVSERVVDVFDANDFTNVVLEPT